MARIMIVDDEDLIRETLRRILESNNYEVVEAPDGKVALEKHRHNPVDLVIMDLFMPEKEGLETIQDFKRKYENVKIIAMSGYIGAGINDFLKSARVFGAEYSFAKPFSSEELLRAVKTLLET